MATAWFFNIPFHGHINPTLPLVRALVENGDELTYFAGPGFEQKISATGATYRAYASDYAFEQSRTVAHAIHQGGQVAEATRALLGSVLAAVAEERPDYLLFDMSAPWGNIAAQRYAIPAITSFPHLPFHWRTFFSDPRVFRKGLQNLKPGQGYYRDLRRQTGKLAREHGLRQPRELNVLSSSSEMNIVFSSRYFQPYDEGFDDSYLFIGPVIDTNRPDDPLVIDRQPGQQLIYIAVGTVYQANLSFFHACIEAFAGDQYAVVMSIGKATDPAALGDIPSNFTVAQYVPQLSILDQADLFITHGGMNSINESVMARVPMIVVPNTLEQAMNAARIEELKAGLYLEPDRVSADKLQLSVERVLSDPAIPRGLELIRDSFVQCGGVEAGAAAVAQFKLAHQIA